MLRWGPQPRHRRDAQYGRVSVWVSPLKCDPKTCSQHLKLTGSLVVCIRAHKLGQALGETHGGDVRHHVPVAAGRVLQPSQLVGMLPRSLWRGLPALPFSVGLWGFIREVPTGPGAGAVGMRLAGGGGTGRGPRVDEMGLGTGASAALQLTPVGVRGMVAWGVTGESRSTSTQIFG